MDLKRGDLKREICFSAGAHTEPDTDSLGLFLLQLALYLSYFSCTWVDSLSGVSMGTVSRKAIS
jgi:hypothetical protein